MDHVRGNIFRAPSHYVIAHAISADLKLGAGIARQIQNRFQVREQIRNQRHLVGDAVYTTHNPRGIYNLVTKWRFFNKPHYADIERALIALRDDMMARRLSHLAVPEIACGLDGCYLPIIIRMIEKIFRNTGIQISMYHL